jgi:nitroreductase
MQPLSPHQVSELIRRRRSVYPKMYTDKPVPEEVILEVLENANWAPNHKLTEPWRFRVFQGAALQRLGDFLGSRYKAQTSPEAFSEMQFEKISGNPKRAAVVIAVCMQRDPQEKVREWEEVAAVACAVQNMWLTCTPYGIGSYWSTPSYILSADDWLGLGPGERCLGLFYMGYYDENTPLPAKRNPVEEKTIWVNE